jgi:hypothetical protein
MGILTGYWLYDQGSIPGCSMDFSLCHPGPLELTPNWPLCLRSATSAPRNLSDVILKLRNMNFCLQKNLSCYVNVLLITKIPNFLNLRLFISYRYRTKI